MTLPANCLRAAVAHRGRLRPISVPRPFDAAAVACVGAPASLTRSPRRHLLSTTSCTAPRWTSPRAPDLTTRAERASTRATRRFSTAVAADYSSEDEPYENETARDGADGRGKGDGRDMPRLRALRERLRDEEGGGMSSRSLGLGSAPRPLEEPPAGRIPSDEVFVEREGSRSGMLTDSHGRRHNYLRISLSERCNLRCQYCMPPEGVPLSPASRLLTDDEILTLVRLFVKNGVDKVRLTGGEPLLRPNLASLVRSISNALASNNKSASDSASGAGLVGITTNGISLSRHIDDLVDAGLTGVNVSLDTLRADRFQEITRRNGLDKVLRAIGDCVRAFRERYGSARVGPDGTGGSRVKINCVVMKGFNDDELADFMRLAEDRFDGDVDVRFIEWMPFNDNGWNTARFVSYNDMMDKIAREGGTPLERAADGPNDTTKWWRPQSPTGPGGGRARIGFITSMSEHFCSSCNRLRITADGKIKVCLFGSNDREVSLRDILRDQSHRKDHGTREEDLAEAIRAAVQGKTFALGGHGSAENIAEAADNRPMTLIGG